MVAGVELRALGAYEGLLQECITAVKQRGHKAVGRELAQLAAGGVVASGLGPAQVMSLRPSRAGQRYRGFSLPMMMEDEVLARTGWQPVPRELRAYFPEGQSSSRGLNLEQRLERQQGLSPSFPEPPEGGRGMLWLLDDVVTTGATMSLAVAIARGLGYDPISCFALAVAEEATG